MDDFLTDEEKAKGKQLNAIYSHIKKHIDALTHEQYQSEMKEMLWDFGFKLMVGSESERFDEETKETSKQLLAYTGALNKIISDYQITEGWKMSDLSRARKFP